MNRLHEFLAALRSAFPLLFSPQFWGIVATSLFGLAENRNWLAPDIMAAFRDIFGFATAYGMGNKIIKKIKAAAPVEPVDNSQPVVE